MTVTDAVPSPPGAARDTPGPESIAGFRRFHAPAAGYDAENAFFAKECELVAVGIHNTGAVAMGAA